MWFLYNILFVVGYVLMLPKFLYRMWRRGGYRKGFAQRFGLYSEGIRRALQQRERIWVHAVSVGEVNVGLEYMKAMRADGCPCGFVLTTTTSTGHAIATRKLDAEDVLLYFPSDLPLFVRRALVAIQPKAILLTESEIWPNLIRLASGRGIPVAMINGRISQSSYKGYTHMHFFARRILRCYRLLMVQSAVDQARLLDLGADPKTLLLLGSAKYDVARRDEAKERILREWLQRLGVTPEHRIILGGSTWPGEEAVLLDLYQRLREKQENVSLVLVPRHAERREEIEAEIRRRGLSWVRRSDGVVTGAQAGAQPDVLLADTTGELMGFYGCSTVVFVGKSLMEHGGQNIIEPALLGKPILVGPNMENFPDVIQDFLQADAVMQVADAEALGLGIERLIADAKARSELGGRAQALVQEKQGVIAGSIAAMRRAGILPDP